MHVLLVTTTQLRLMPHCLRHIQLVAAVAGAAAEGRGGLGCGGLLGGAVKPIGRRVWCCGASCQFGPPGGRKLTRECDVPTMGHAGGAIFSSQREPFAAKVRGCRRILTAAPGTAGLGDDVPARRLRGETAAPSPLSGGSCPRGVLLQPAAGRPSSPMSVTGAKCSGSGKASGAGTERGSLVCILPPLSGEDERTRRAAAER